MKPHAIMISVPYQGHLNPFVHLALKLASKGFKVTFVNTEYAHHCITKSMIRKDNNNEEIIDIFAQTRDSSGLDIQYRTISDGFPLEYDRVANIKEFWYSLVDDFPKIADEFVCEIIASLPDDDLPILVADTYPGWASKVANKYNLVNVSFWTEPALVFAATYHMDLLVKNGHFPPKDDDAKYSIEYIPGVESISSSDLPGYLRQSSESLTPGQKIVFSSFDEVKEKADFILHNTVQELEPHVLSSLNLTHPTYAIGPINFYKERGDELAHVPKSLFAESDCSKWLDAKPFRSVLYISFGSVHFPDERTMDEIMGGLEKSGVYFLWAVKGDDDGGGVFLKDGLKEKGLIVPWCDQREVLSHHSVGAFLTHCGWNSVLESMWFGVPMVCCPLDSDQPTNRKLVVDDWMVGVDIRRRRGGGEAAVNAEEVAENIKKAMGISGEDGMGQEIERVRNIVRKALGEGGSSEENFNRFIDDLMDKIRRP